MSRIAGQFCIKKVHMDTFPTTQPYQDMFKVCNSIIPLRSKSYFKVRSRKHRAIPNGPRPMPPPKGNALALLVNVRATNGNTSSLDLAFDQEDDYESPTYWQRPERPYRSPLSDWSAGQAKIAMITPPIRKMSCRDRRTFKPNTQSPLRQCHYPDSLTVNPEEQFRQSKGLATRVGGLFPSISRRDLERKTSGGKQPEHMHQACSSLRRSVAHARLPRDFQSLKGCKNVQVTI
ncbi:hypothetical protein K439DRAFT_1630340 [Ramaria rubella]|nr:hypothetical protein K439DRAFT_1630340 [Ramaria rubella]